MAEPAQPGLLFDLDAGKAAKRDALERFDLVAGKAAKKDGLERFEVKAADWLGRAREAAREICRRKGTVTSEEGLEVVGMPEGVHHNVIGAIFQKGFVRVGFRRTRRPEGHARLIGVWRFKQ